MLKALSVLAVIFMSLQVSATPTVEQEDRNEELYNLEGDLGLKGYDPVAYFKEHEGMAIEGDSAISAKYGKVVYYFSSEDNRDQFLSDPTKYEPTFGGWCAWAMANQGYANINPMLYTQNGDRMHFFINKGAKARFDKDLKTREMDADDFWKAESGENPRF